MYKYNGTGNNGLLAWLLQRISGIIILLFVIIIFCQIAFGEGMHALSSWLLFPVLAFGLWHTLSGFKMITDDYVSCPTARFFLLCLYWLIGIGVLALGFTII